MGVVGTKKENNGAGCAAMEKTGSNCDSVEKKIMSVPSYFDKIPSDVVGNVVRFMSERPNAIDWARYLAPTDVILVASAGASLHCGVAGTLKCVRSGNLYAKCVSCDLSLLSYRACRCLGNGSRAVFSAEDPQYFSFMVNHYDSQFDRLVGYLGAFVEVIGFPLGECVTPHKARAVVRHCTAMRELSIYDPCDTQLLRDILECRGAQLHKLQCNWNLGFLSADIARHCSNLKELCLRSEQGLDTVLGAVGKQLTVLDVSEYVAEQSYYTIRENCPNLTTFRVFCNPFLYDVLIAFYVSYGPQLEQAHFFNFNAAQCRRVLNACTNLEVLDIDVYADSDGDDAIGYGDGVFAELQNSSVHSANVDYETLIKGEGHLSVALNKCENIASLNIFGRSWEEDDGIHLETFRLPMPTLQEFSTGYLRPKEAMELAKATGALETLRIFIDFEEEAHEEIWAALEQVVRFNPGLAQVKMHVLNFWSVGSSTNEYDNSDEDSDGGEHIWNEVLQRFDAPPPRPQRATDEIPLGVSDPDGECFLFHLLGAFGKAHNLRELVVVSYPNVNEYWDYLYCVEDACTYFGLRHRRLSLAVLGVDYLPLEVYRADDEGEGDQNKKMEVADEENYAS